jgi:pectate lyase
MSLTYKNRAVVLVSLIASSILWISGCVGVGKATLSQPPNSGVTLVTVAPSKASSITSGTLAFIATTQGTSSNTSVTWKALLGTITSAGVYTAPAKAGIDTVTATSVADPSKTSSSSITVTATVANPLVASIIISPTSAKVAASGTFQFASTVQGSATDKSVHWTASLGTINSAGSYAAPTSAGNDVVTAISDADSTKIASASVTVSAAATTPSQSASCGGAPCPAFPGAAGGGAGSVGGRGGVVIEVTNTNDSGTGSLRNCVQATGARTCVFRVAGVFNITSGDNYAGNPFLTIACQSAPGEVIIGGPNSNGAALRISTHDVVLRYCTFSPDNANTTSGPDTGTVGITIVNCGGDGTLTSGGCYNIISDHLTTRWSGNKSWITTSNFTPAVNGNGNGDGPNHSITAQWSLDYEPHEGHPVGFGTATDETCVGTRANPACLSVYETDIDFHHDMFVNVDHRIPENSNGSTRWINNIVYNWSFYANEWLGAEIIDDINNKFVKGNLNGQAQAHPIHFTTNSPEMSGAPSVYVSGNIFGAAGANTVASDQYGTLVSQITGENGDETGPIPSSWERSGSMAASNAFPIVSDAAENLDSLMLGTVGNSQHVDCSGNWVSHRDAADQRIVAQYQNGGSGGFWPNGVTYTGLSTFPTPTSGWQDNPITNFSACQESLHDGIPDQWKTLKGLSTTDANLYKRTASNGYTYLENYLNGVDNN